MDPLIRVSCSHNGSGERQDLGQDQGKVRCIPADEPLWCCLQREGTALHCRHVCSPPLHTPVSDGAVYPKGTSLFPTTDALIMVKLCPEFFNLACIGLYKTHCLIWMMCDRKTATDMDSACAEGVDGFLWSILRVELC